MIDVAGGAGVLGAQNGSNGLGINIVPEPSSLVLLAMALPVGSYVLRCRGLAGR